MKLKVLLFSLVSILFLTFSYGQSTSASALPESPVNLSNTVDEENLYILEADGSTLNFDNIDDMKKYVDAFKKPQGDNVASIKTLQKNSIEPSFNTLQVSEGEGDFQAAVFGETIIGTEYKKYHFMGYSKFTPDWAKPSSYTTLSSQSQSFSQKISTKWGDTTASYTQSQGVNRTIPADAKRWSRLAGYADLKIVRKKITQPSFGTIYTTKVTKTNSYIAVKYK